MANSVFRKESLDKVSSPEQLNDYIKVSGVSVWIIIVSAIVLLASGLVWSAAANLQTTVSVNGVVKNGVYTCYVADVSDIKKGTEVNLGNGVVGEIISVSANPFSADEIAQRYSDYEVYTLALADWSYEVTVSAGDAPNGPCAAQIVIDTVKPISFLWSK